MSAVFLVIAAIAALYLARCLVIARQASRRPKKLLTEHEPSGYYKANWLKWQVFKWLFLTLLWPVHKRIYSLIGQENVERISDLHRRGYQICFMSNHDSSVNVWMPQAFFWLKGYHFLAENFHYLIGLQFFNRHPFFWWGIRAVPRTPLVPPTMVNWILDNRQDLGLQVFKEQHARINAINGPAKVVVAEKLEQGLCLLLYPQGTRQRQGLLSSPNELLLDLLPSNGKVVLVPVFQSGGYEMWRPETKPNPLKFWHKITLVIGEPEFMEDLQKEGLAISKTHQIMPRKASVILLMERIAALARSIGQEKVCGEFNVPLTERFPKKELTTSAV